LNNHFATEQIFRGTNNFSHYAAAPRPNIALPRTPCSSFWTALGLMLVTLFRGDAVDEARGPVRWLVKIATPKRRLALPDSGASTPARGFRQVRVHAVAKTGDLSKARRLAAIEDARARAAIDRAQRQFDAQKADIVDLTEGEAWSLAVEWLLENEKRAPVDRTPQEHVEEALFNIVGIAGDDSQEVAHEEAEKWLRRNGIGEVTLPRVLVWVPAQTQPARCAGRIDDRNWRHEGELDSGRRYSGVL
jgi:hypothetical protein